MGSEMCIRDSSIEVLSVDQMGEDALGHGAAADVAVANHEHFNFILHIFVFPCISLFFLGFITLSRHLT